MVPDRTRAMLSPMAGVTDRAFRTLCYAHGAGLCVTEMVSAKGFMLCARESEAQRRLLEVAPEEAGRTAVQIFGHEPEIMAETARRLSSRGVYSMVDINMGCPVPKVVGNGDGSALMRDPEGVRRVVRAVSQASALPVSVKMRLGFAPEERRLCLRLGEICQENGASLITLHARTRSQFYEGRADWPAIREMRRCLSIPVVGNGDITDATAALRMLEETGCDAVAVGRAAQGNPFIFSQIHQLLTGAPVYMPTPMERLGACLWHLNMLISFKGEETAVREMRRHAGWYTRSLRGAAAFRTRVNVLTTGEAFRKECTAFFTQAEREENIS